YESSQLLRTEQIRGEMLHLRGRCRLAAGGRKAAAGALREAKALEREPAPWLGALATLLRAGCAAAVGDNRDALGLLRSAVDQLDAADLRLFAAAARRRLGHLLGGDEGRTLAAAGDTVMTSEEIKDPGRMTNM